MDRSLPPQTPEPSASSRVSFGLIGLLQLIMFVELLALLYRGQWLNSLQVAAIMTLTLSPVLFRSRLPVNIPSEFQFLTIAFVFAALFLGELRNYYELIWWWDIGLHATSGLLFGVLGFLLVYVLNEDDRIDLKLQPRFMAMFAFAFSFTVGGLWEVFEFIMDETFATQMQKPRAGDPSGLTDTMWDLGFDALGALVISAFGWWYMARDESSFLENWIHKFVGRNGHLFRRKRVSRARTPDRSG